MDKDKYQISRKSDFICLTILLDDLNSYRTALDRPEQTKDGLVTTLRNTRNVFVSLHNLRDSMNRIRLSGDESFIAKSRALRKELDFIAHIRNKGVGHLDRDLLERAAQWMPQIFAEDSQEKDEYIAFECYRTVLESAINSYLNEDGGQKVFETEIDFLYPPNQQQFYDFLGRIIEDAINWLSIAREMVKSEIQFHSADMTQELGAIAGQTNFNLKEGSKFTYSEEQTKEALAALPEKLREIGTDEKVILFFEEQFLKKYNKASQRDQKTAASL
ncbi:hypothetical protein ACT3R4_18175 [Halomonas sp. AOP7-E1-9]